MKPIHITLITALAICCPTIPAVNAEEEVTAGKHKWTGSGPLKKLADDIQDNYANKSVEGVRDAMRETSGGSRGQPAVTDAEKAAMAAEKQAYIGKRADTRAKLDSLADELERLRVRNMQRILNGKTPENVRAGKAIKKALDEVVEARNKANDDIYKVGGKSAPEREPWSQENSLEEAARRNAKQQAQENAREQSRTAAGDAARDASRTGAKETGSDAARTGAHHPPPVHHPHPPMGGGGGH